MSINKACKFSCPICKTAQESKKRLMAHVANCSVHDALDNITDSDISAVSMLEAIATLGQDARALMLTDAFDHATEDERSVMYACRSCYAVEDIFRQSLGCHACRKEDTILLAGTIIAQLRS